MSNQKNDRCQPAGAARRAVLDEVIELDADLQRCRTGRAFSSLSWAM